MVALDIDAKDMSKEEVSSKFVEIIKELSDKVGITQTVKDVGGKEEDLDMLAEKAMNDACKPGNPREVTKEDFVALFNEAM